MRQRIGAAATRVAGPGLPAPCTTGPVVAYSARRTNQHLLPPLCLSVPLTVYPPPVTHTHTHTPSLPFHTHTTGTPRLCAPSCHPARALLPHAYGPGRGLRPSACATATAQGPFWDRCAPWLFFTCTLHFSTLRSWLRQALHCLQCVLPKEALKQSKQFMKSQAAYAVLGSFCSQSIWQGTENGIELHC